MTELHEAMLSPAVVLAEMNFYHFMLDNECYATTGGQPVPNAKNVSYDLFARAAGYERTFAFDNLEAFAINIERILAGPGPVFAAMKVVPEIRKPADRHKRWVPPSREHTVQALQEELGIGM